jgi:hypothetical protein
MFLLHPTVAPWLARTERGWHVALLTGRDDATAVYLRTLPDNEEALLKTFCVGFSPMCIRSGARASSRCPSKPSSLAE